EIQRVLKIKDIDPSVAAFRVAERDDSDLVMLIYSPERGSVDALDEIRDFLPDYVRSAPMSDRSKNAMTIFALVKDIKKFLDLVDLFEEPGKDPRVIKKIVLEHIMPGEAIDSLGKLMDLSGSRTGTRTSSGKGRRTTVVRTGASRGISILPDDAQQVLIVRALQSDIDEIERLLPYIDVDTSGDSEFVIIPLEHVTTATIMTGLRPLLAASGGPVTAAPKATKRRTSKGPATAGQVANDEVTIVPEPRTNKLIVVGTDEGIERVREIVALLDVESEGDRPTFVKLEYADPAALAAAISPIVQQMYPQAGFSATPDETHHSITLIGNRQALELAQELIVRADIEGVTPKWHKIRLYAAIPSEVATMLSRFETGSPAKPAPRIKRKKGARTAPRRSTVSVAGKFIGDDASGMLYVICTDTEWEETYLPYIREMEEDAERPIETHVVAVTEADPQTVIDTLTPIVGGERGDVVTMVAVPDGIMLVNATRRQIDEIEALVPVIAVDPQADFERQKFEIEHADPAVVREFVLTMMSSGPVPAPMRIQPKRKGGKITPRRIGPSAVPDIKIVEVGRSLMVYAPADKMEEIGQLIAEADVDTAVTDIRIYPFPAGVNVQEVADTLTRLYGGRPAAASPRGRPKSASKAAPSTIGGVTIIARPTSHSILVSAPIEEFERIEETLQKIGTESATVRVIYAFIDVQHGSAATIAGLIDPILKNLLNQSIETGEIPRPTGAGPKSSATQSLLVLQADPADDRLIIAAPELIVAEARSLVTALDRADSTERVIRTITLDKADPEEMAATIQTMLSGQRSSQRTQPRQRGKAQPVRPSSRVGSGAGLDVTVTTAPGGGALVLMGKARDVEEVEGWIRELDATATDIGGKIVKIFDLGDADVEQVADTLMAVVDSGAAKGARAPAKPKDDAFSFDFYESMITRQGKDLYISADKFSGTMLVAATPVKMRHVEDLIELFVRDDEIKDLFSSGEVMPYMTYELENADAFDAVYTLGQIIDAVWAYEDKPNVDYIPFTNILVVKGNPEHFKEVEELIVKYVDQGTGTGTRGLDRAIIPIIGTNMIPSQAALLLKARLESMGLTVDLAQLNPTEVSSGVERVGVHPCLLPPSLFLVATGQAEWYPLGFDAKTINSDGTTQSYVHMIFGQYFINQLS
ncbi:MAG: hypothetical protein IID40_07335, partial [Planctomycetes bacterium]|nr:hypothetical protein [Planctomycetota bacterium]